MTRDDIITMACQANGKIYLGGPHFSWDQAERFAALVAAAEREACADICDQHASAEGIAQRCAAAIRARRKEQGMKLTHEAAA
jgi:hypothetical protein